MRLRRPWRVVVAWTVVGTVVGTFLGTELGDALFVGGGLGGLVGSGLGYRQPVAPGSAVEASLVRASVSGGLTFIGLLAITVARAGRVDAVLLYGGMAVTAGFFGRRHRARQRLQRGVEVLTDDQLAVRRSGLVELATSRWWPRAERDHAAYQLGTLAMAAGELDQAARWLTPLRAGVTGTYARLALALVVTLRGETQRANDLLGEVHRGRTDPRVRAQADAVRVLLVWREQGDAAALETAERVLAPTSPVLLRGLTAVLRDRADDTVGTLAMLDEGTRAALVERGWHLHLPELGELLART
jgi:hypothetical protein